MKNLNREHIHKIRKIGNIIISIYIILISYLLIDSITLFLSEAETIDVESDFANSNIEISEDYILNISLQYDLHNPGHFNLKLKSFELKIYFSMSFMNSLIKEEYLDRNLNIDFEPIMILIEPMVIEKDESKMISFGGLINLTNYFDTMVHYFELNSEIFTFAEIDIDPADISEYFNLIINGITFDLDFAYGFFSSSIFAEYDQVINLMEEGV